MLNHLECLYSFKAICGVVCGSLTISGWVEAQYDDRYTRLIQVPVLSEWTLSHCNGKIVPVKILFSILSLSKFHYRKN